MSARMAVGIDGGASGIRIRVEGQARAIETDGLGRLEGDVLAGLIERVRGGLSVLPGGAPQIGRMVWGLTVAPAGQDSRTEMARDLATAFAATRVDLAGDAITAHAGAFAGRTGVVLTIGTGVACLGLNLKSGVMRKVDGDGFLLGDAGSAFWLGSRGVEAALRALDGRGPATTLVTASTARYGTHEDLAVWLHGRPRAVSEIARFAIDVQEAASAGDAVAQRLVDDAADELVLAARAAARDLAAGACPLALSGRAVAPGTALHIAVQDRLAMYADELVPTAALGGPLEGAWAIAEGRLGDRYAEFFSTWRQ